MSSTVRKRKKPYQPLIPLNDEEVLGLALYNASKLEPKFRAGMKRYPTPIWYKSGLAEMLPEILDLFSYHALAQAHWARVHRLLSDLVDDKPHLAKDIRVRDMFAILGPKELAKKKAE